MARINIEDTLFRDNRFTDLVLKLGSRTMALGAFVEACLLAQEHFLSVDNDRLIPLADWARNSVLDAVVEVGFAEVRTGGIYVSGSREQFGWLIQRSNAGKKPKRPRTKKSKTTVNDRSSTVNGSNPLPLPLTLSPSQSQAPAQGANAAHSKPQAFIATYCRLFKVRWGINPPIQGKDKGIINRLAESLTEARFEFLMTAYLQLPDAWLVKQKHPLNLFESKLNEIVVEADTGKFTTMTEVRQADAMATNYQLLKKIKSGEA